MFCPILVVGASGELRGACLPAGVNPRRGPFSLPRAASLCSPRTPAAEIPGRFVLRGGISRSAEAEET